MLKDVTKYFNGSEDLKSLTSLNLSTGHKYVHLLMWYEYFIWSHKKAWLATKIDVFKKNRSAYGPPYPQSSLVLILQRRIRLIQKRRRREGFQ